MTFNIEERFNKNVEEVNALANKHKELFEQTQRFKAEAEKQLQDAQNSLQGLFLEINKKQAIIDELAPYIKSAEPEKAKETKTYTQEEVGVAAAV